MRESFQKRCRKNVYWDGSLSCEITANSERRNIRITQCPVRSSTDRIDKERARGVGCFDYVVLGLEVCSQGRLFFEIFKLSGKALWQRLPMLLSLNSAGKSLEVILPQHWTRSPTWLEPLNSKHALSMFVLFWPSYWWQTSKYHDQDVGMGPQWPIR